MEQLNTPFYAKKNDYPLQEYPRPQFERDSYINLNGFYDYAIYEDRILRNKIDKSQGKILVPFSPESFLSGVNKVLQPYQTLCYERKFTVQKGFLKDITLINFGAVDYKCSVYINDKFCGDHIGGYNCFSFDISEAIKEGENKLFIQVNDPSDTHYQQRGKQKLKHGGIWYTPSSGIWQTVWLESFSHNHIKSLKITPDIDNMRVKMEISSPLDYNVILHDKEDTLLYSGREKEIVIKLDSFELWTPENPKLYYFSINNGEDIINSYFAMRKISYIEACGKKVFALNNKPFLVNGLLDQGYWSDGLYTCPSDEGLIYDIMFAKESGFNILRKHIKIEPMRWYYHCDRLGMLVWQDFINGGGNYKFCQIAIKPTLKFSMDDTDSKSHRLLARIGDDNKKEFVDDMISTVNQLYNCPCICLWTVFNEAWGQFDSESITNLLKKLDNSRLIDSTSGWYDQGSNEMRSIHRYILKMKVPNKETRPIAFTEYGGYSYACQEHVFNKKKSFGYLKFKNIDQFINAISKLYNTQVLNVIKNGASALIYTQLSDVEEELNGLITYDRQIEKIPRQQLKELNEMLYITFNNKYI